MKHEVVLCRGLPDASASWDLAHALAEAAAVALGQGPVRVRVHRNRRTLIRWRVRDGSYEISLHHAFLSHPDDVLAVVQHRNEQAWRRLSSLPRQGAAPTLSTSGHVHDLAVHLAAEHDRVRWVQPPTNLAVGWGRWPTRQPRRHLRLGSCAAGPPPVIRLHPSLDHRDVPGFFVAFVLFHELLHLRFPPVERGRRRVVHPQSFRAAERRHPDYDRATAWEQVHVTALLARTRHRVRTRAAAQ